MVQSLAELNGAIAVVAKPYNVLDHPSWLGLEDGSVAAYFRRGGDCEFSVLSPLERGQVFVVIQWRKLTVIGVYFSPSRTLEELDGFLDELGRVVRRHQTCPMLVLGNFNSKCTAWGSPRTDSKGEALEAFAAVSGLVVLN
ncbi:uncharacterized protein LOC109861247 [Pseudomyrmex gracilis]|uniref:uncharacterized protein LOC109861247 n=1 Tax=Pseudomyrmex gracilis TaxID=219809 RepID=UPI0009959119|nr:uncharacterized protein LOC109861247 [Pseudomyrmex gracilis]